MALVRALEMADVGSLDRRRLEGTQRLRSGHVDLIAELGRRTLPPLPEQGLELVFRIHDASPRASTRTWSRRAWRAIREREPGGLHGERIPRLGTRRQRWPDADARAVHLSA